MSLTEESKESTPRGRGLDLPPGRGLTPACIHKCLKFKVPKMPKVKGLHPFWMPIELAKTSFSFF